MNQMLSAVFVAMLAASPVLAQSTVDQTLMHHENEMLSALQKKDMAGFKKYVQPGSWSVDAGGYMMIDEFEKIVKDPKANFTWESFKASDMKVVHVDAGSALVTYKLEQKGSMMGEAFPSPVYATTVWTKRGNNWVAVFHQESTAAKK